MVPFQFICAKFQLQTVIPQISNGVVLPHHPSQLQGADLRAAHSAIPRKHIATTIILIYVNAFLPWGSLRV